MAKCFSCGKKKKGCRCHLLPDNICVACGKRFKGKHYFSWAFHQAACKYERGLSR